MKEFLPDTAREPLWTLREDYRVLRSDETGAGRYRFYSGDRMIGSAHVLVQRNWPLVINCGALVFNSFYDMETTYYPGSIREIIDADDPANVVAKLIFRTVGQYELQVNFSTGLQRLQIHSAEDTHLFYRDDAPIARITPAGDVRQKGDWNVHCRMESLEELSDELALMMLCYPLLRFAL